MIVVYGWEGEGDVVEGTSYTGKERFYVYESDSTGARLSDTAFCLHEWDFTSSAVLSDCSDCVWAFTLDGANGAKTEGTCDQVGDPEATAGPYNYGYGTYNYAGTDYNVMFYGGSSGWSAVAEATYASGKFTYDWVYGLAYY